MYWLEATSQSHKLLPQFNSMLPTSGILMNWNQAYSAGSGQSDAFKWGLHTHKKKKKKSTWKVYEAAGCVFQKVFYTWLCFSFNNKLFGFQTRTHALSSAARKQWRDISKDVIVCRINHFCVCLCFVFLFLCFGLRIDGWGQILFSHRKEFTWHVFGSFFDLLFNSCS